MPLFGGKADEKSKDGASSAAGKTNPEIVAPGEDDPDDNNRKLDFERSVVMMASRQSTMSGVGTREKWGSKMQFLMSCIASAVGLGNVWRFPAICAKNGGAAFLIPYAIVLTLIARPLFVLELSLGQFSSKGSVRCWDMSPILTGVGVAGCVSSVLLSTFYIMLLAWSLIYSLIAFVSICYNPTGTPIWTEETGRYFGGEVLRALEFQNENNTDIVTWKPIAHLVLALMFAWGLIWITMVFGVEASGKVAYVTALAPYFVLILLLIAGLCLPGMVVGLKFLFYPDPAKLIDGNTWFQAVGQCFFSLGIGFGGCIMFSSFNDFNNDIIKDVYIIAVIDSCTSVLAGMSLLSILGFQASKTYDDLTNSTDTKIKEKFDFLKGNCSETYGAEAWGKLNDESMVAEYKECVLKDIIGEEGGAGLAFVHYPAAMNEINKIWGHPIGTIMGLLFFLMLILLAVGSANGFVGTTVTIICDKKQKWKRSNVVSGVCAFSCCIGLIYTNPYGSSWFDVVDIHGVTAVVYVLAFLEAVAVSFVYGLKNFCDDISYMRQGRKTGWYLKITWVVLPILMVMIYIYWLVGYNDSIKRYKWTPAVIAIGWILTITCLSVIPITAVMKYLAFKKQPWRKNVPPTFTSILRAIKNPSPRWGPMEASDRSGWKEFKASVEPSYHVWARFLQLFKRGGENSAVVYPTPRMSYATQAVPSGQNQSTAPGQEAELTGVKTEKPENKNEEAEKRESTTGATGDKKKSRQSVASQGKK